MNRNPRTAPGIPDYAEDIVFPAGDPHVRQNQAPQLQQLPEQLQNQALPEQPRDLPMPVQPENPPQPHFIPQPDPLDNQLAIGELVYPQPEPPRDMPLLDEDEADEDLEDFGPFARGPNVPNGPNRDGNGSPTILYHGDIDVSVELAEEALPLGAAAAAATVVCVSEHRPEAFMSMMQEASSVMGREDVVSFIDWSTASYCPIGSILAGPTIFIRVAQPGELEALASDREGHEQRQREAYERALGIEIADDEAPGAAALGDDAPAMEDEEAEFAGFDAPSVKDPDDAGQGAGASGAEPQGSAAPDFQGPRAPAPGAELANVWAQAQDRQKQDSHAATPSGSPYDYEALVPEFDE